MLKYILIGYLMLCSTLLSAQDAERLRGLSIAATSANDFTLTPQSRFAWLEEGREIHQDERLQGSGMAELIEGAIQERLQSLGFRFEDDRTQAELLIAYVAGMEDAVTDQELLSRFGLLPGYPSLKTTDSPLGRGALVLYLVDANTRRVVWRCAAQTLVDFDAPADVRRKRIATGISSMLETLPIAGR